MKLPTDRWNRNIEAYSDESFLKSIYQKNYTTIEQYILKNSGTVDDAKDIYQEAFLSVWRNIQMGKFIPENSSAVSAYLYIVAKNKWIDYLRSASFRLRSSISNEDFLAGGAKEESTEEDILFEQSILKVKEALHQIGANCKSLLTSFYYAKQSLKTIASTFGWTEATTKNNKYRCLQKLREIVKNLK